MKTARITVALLAAITVCIVLSVSVEAAERRLALVIGNAAYQNAPLKNTINDANDMEKALNSLNFKVIARVNADRRVMIEAIAEFGKLLRQYDVGLFYFAGHGVQSNGLNYLIPVDNSNINKQGDLEFEAVDVRRILNEMDDAGNHLNVVILDACRDNPLPKSLRTLRQGLAPVTTSKDKQMLIAYSTAPDSVADDGRGGRNGIYTKNLLTCMVIPGLKIEDVFKRVRIKVKEDTKKSYYGQQVPWESSSLTSDFYFKAVEEKSDESRNAKPEPVKPAEIPKSKEPSTQIVNPSVSEKSKYRLRNEPMTTDDSTIFFKAGFFVKNEFKDNGDSTITNHITYLMWQKSGSSNYMNYENAKAYIDELNRKKFAGYDDWRLPTVDELKSLLTPETQSDGLYINPIFDKNQSWCWTSDQRTSGGVWVVGFNNSSIGCNYSSSYVRAVRSLK